MITDDCSLHLMLAQLVLFSNLLVTKKQYFLDVWSKIRLNQWIGNCNEEIGDHIKENQWTWQIYCKGYERNKE